jgi:hypothetical protein
MDIANSLLEFGGSKDLKSSGEFLNPAGQENSENS